MNAKERLPPIKGAGTRAAGRALQAVGIALVLAAPLIVLAALATPSIAPPLFWAGAAAAGALVGGLGLAIAGWGVASTAVAERALVRTEGAMETFGNLLDTVQDAVIVADAQGRIVAWNPAATTIFGYPVEDALRMNVEMLVPARLRARHRAGMSSFRATGHGRFVDAHEALLLPALRKDGEEVQIELTLSPLPNGRLPGAGPHALAIVRDVTQRERARAEAGRLQRQQQLILSSVREGIYGLDVRGNTTFVNAAGARMMQYAPEELVGKSIHDVLHHTHEDGTPYPREACPILQTLQEGSVRRVERDVFWRKGGTPVHVRWVSAPVWEGDALVGAVVTFEALDAGPAREAAAKAAHAMEPPHGSP